MHARIKKIFTKKDRSRITFTMQNVCFQGGQRTTEITKFSKDFHIIIVEGIRNGRIRGRNLLNHV
jgi:hypothetical protein